MIERLLDVGIDSPTLPVALNPLFGDLAQKAQVGGADIAPAVLSASSVYTHKLLKLAGKFHDAPTIEEVKAETFGEEDVVLQKQLESEPPWVGIYRARVLAEIRRLQGSDTETAAKEIFGTGIVKGRATAFRHATNSATTDAGLAVWGGGNLALGLFWNVADGMAPVTYQHQVVATIDERTTTCCLLAHGQIQDLDDPFKLNGHPRFRDEMDHPPFHWHCRTSVGLYTPDFEQLGVSTSDMQGAARSELTSRLEGKGRVEIHPSHATSGRN